MQFKFPFEGLILINKLHAAYFTICIQHGNVWNKPFESTAFNKIREWEWKPFELAGTSLLFETMPTKNAPSRKMSVHVFLHVNLICVLSIVIQT